MSVYPVKQIDAVIVFGHQIRVFFPSKRNTGYYLKVNTNIFIDSRWDLFSMYMFKQMSKNNKYINKYILREFKFMYSVYIHIVFTHCRNINAFINKSEESPLIAIHSTIDICYIANKTA